MGKCYKLRGDEGDIDKARSCIKRVYEGRQELLGENDPETIEAKEELEKLSEEK